MHIRIVRLLACLLVAVSLVGLLTLRPAAHAAAPAVQVWLTTTDGANHLTRQTDLQLNSGSGASPAITINDAQQYQQMDGFGAAVTDSSAWLLYTKMSASQRNTVMTNLFGTDPSNPTSIGLSFVRIPMGASDFSINGAYSYDDMPAGQTDPTLAHFSIAHDTSYILPILQQAYQLNPGIRFMANPWSPPGWMKSNGSMIGVYNGQTGTLNSSAYGPLAQYFVKFIQAYQAQGIPIYAISPQNEPLYVPPDYPGMSWPANDESSFIKNNLAPALNSASLHPKILGYDHDWNGLGYAQTLLNDPTTNSDLAGIAWHCYNGDPSAMSSQHNQYPTKEIYETECATGISITHISTINLLMQSVQNWARSVELWNIALDPNHGPHSGGCTECWGVVTIDQNTGNVTYSNDYYLLGQFSKFVVPGAYHIAASTPGSGNVNDVAFKNPDGSYVLVANNGGSSSSTFSVNWNNQTFSYTLPAGATVSFVWSGNTTQVTPTPGTTVTPTSTPTSTPTPGVTPTPTVGITPTPTPGITPTPTTGITPTPTTSSGGGCKVSYTVNSQWPGGFGASIVITNTGNTTINGWQLTFSFANGQTITQLWNGSYTQSGGAVTISNLSYNGTIAPGGTVNPGFNGAWSGSNTNPTAFALNGVACSS
ncbi:MAG TPA: cellulose binding domain-containing protein [Ktedonobacteraceae bacterium]|nr:cellulose binding domain-containing protein [Ktedonobacteraceae bacterium]